MDKKTPKHSLDLLNNHSGLYRTLFSLAFGSEAVILIDVELMSHRNKTL